MLGYTREEFLGKKLWKIGPFKDIAESKAAFQELQKKEYFRYEYLPLETKDGKHIDVEFISNVYRENGTRVIQCNIRDITARHQAEEALAKHGGTAHRAGLGRIVTWRHPSPFPGARAPRR